MSYSYRTIPSLQTLLVGISLLVICVVVWYIIITSNDSNIIINYKIRYQKSVINYAKSGATLENPTAAHEVRDPAMVEKITTTLAAVKVFTKVNRKTEGSTISPETTGAKVTAHLRAKAAGLTHTTKPTIATKATYKKFVICHSYWEQQMNAVLNMWSFQKWAKKSGNYGVVEPFAHDSVLGFSEQNIFQHNFKTSLRFRDYFDLGQWNKGTEKYKIPPLVNWSEFVEHASRSIHLAICVYKEPGGIFEGDDIKNNPACASEFRKFQSVLGRMLGLLKFRIEKVVCFSFRKYYRTLEDFNSPFNLNSNDTIYFTEWTGIGRMGIGDSTLQRESEPDILTTLLPSARILSDSRRYVKRVLNVDFQSYTAVVFRSVRRLQEMEADGFNHGEVIQHYYSCINQLPYILDHVGRKSFWPLIWEDLVTRLMAMLAVLNLWKCFSTL